MAGFDLCSELGSRLRAEEEKGQIAWTYQVSPLPLPWLRSCFGEEISVPNTLDSHFVLILEKKKKSVSKSQKQAP